MGVCLLAPVPARFLKSALVVCNEQGRVAFGTDAWEVFGKLDGDYGEKMPVLIYATHPDHDPHQFCDPAYVRFQGVYNRTQKPKGGKHPNLLLRPTGTITGEEPDTSWALFWEVTELKWLSKDSRIALTSLTAEGQKKPLPAGFVPHGPMIVRTTLL